MMSSIEWRMIEDKRVPFVEGLPLCSLRNPEREADKWQVSQKACSDILVVGIGAGFHLKNLESKDVLIFDPCEELVLRAQESWSQLAQRMTSQREVVSRFMFKMPAVWIFRPAFNGRLDELRDIEHFLVDQEQIVGEVFLSAMNFKNVKTVWQSFSHRELKFSIHDFPSAAPKESPSFENSHIDILRELVR